MIVLPIMLWSRSLGSGALRYIFNLARMVSLTSAGSERRTESKIEG
jgi:hypothetical protein